MDNISHSLVGLTFAESLYQCYEKKVFDNSTRESDPRFRMGLWILSFIASNVPDLDFIYAVLFETKKMGMVLHHRGHTHTFLMAVPQGILIGALFFILSKWKNWKWSIPQWFLLFVVSISGIVIHLLLDSLNSYGTHPFWPFDKRWYYGDIAFIVEPYFWVVFTPLLFCAASSLALKILFASLFFTIVLLCWTSGMVLPELAAVVTLSGGLLSVLALCSEKKRLVHAVTWIFCFFFIWGFHFCSDYSKTKVRSILTEEDPGIVIHDTITTPFPANPFCWSTLVVESLGPVASYRIQRFLSTPFPFIMTVERCLKIEMAKAYRTVGLTQPYNSFLHGFGFQEFSIVRFRELAKSHCGFGAWLHFSRAPAFEEKGGKLVVRDMRFDLSRPNFTEFEFPLNMPMHPGCDLGVDWEFPRADLLLRSE